MKIAPVKEEPGSGKNPMEPQAEVTTSKRTKSYESRKIRKPLMEKKRRARINESLDALKMILLEANEAPTKKDGSRPAKLEKADILELTVKHLKSIHNASKTTTNITNTTNNIDNLSQNSNNSNKSSSSTTLFNNHCSKVSSTSVSDMDEDTSSQCGDSQSQSVPMEVTPTSNDNRINAKAITPPTPMTSSPLAPLQVDTVNNTIYHTQSIPENNNVQPNIIHAVAPCIPYGQNSTQTLKSSQILGSNPISKRESPEMRHEDRLQPGHCSSNPLYKRIDYPEEHEMMQLKSQLSLALMSYENGSQASTSTCSSNHQGVNRNNNSPNSSNNNDNINVVNNQNNIIVNNSTTPCLIPTRSNDGALIFVWRHLDNNGKIIYSGSGDSNNNSGHSNHSSGYDTEGSISPSPDSSHHHSHSNTTVKVEKPSPTCTCNHNQLDIDDNQGVWRPW